MADVNRAQITRNNIFLSLLFYNRSLAMFLAVIESIKWFEIGPLSAAVAFIVNIGRPYLARMLDYAVKKERLEWIGPLRILVVLAFVYTMLTLAMIIYGELSQYKEMAKQNDPILKIYKANLDSATEKLDSYRIALPQGISSRQQLETLLIKKKQLELKLKNAKEAKNVKAAEIEKKFKK